MTQTSSRPTSLDLAFWQQQPHLFLPAAWGERYCRCCLDAAEAAVHVDAEAIDPAIHPDSCTGYRVGRREQTSFSVTGWNDGGGSCSYASIPSYSEALAFVDYLKSGGDQGRVWQHYQIEERRSYTAVDTNVMVLQ